MDIFFSLLQFVPSIWRYIRRWWSFTRPAGNILGPMIDNKKVLRIFIKDFYVHNNTLEEPKLISQEGDVFQFNPNIDKVFAEVEVQGVSLLGNLLGQIGKREKIKIMKMSEGYSLWDTDFFILGAQALKCREFYELMDNCGYSMDEHRITDRDFNQTIEREELYGYGLIIKAEKDGVGNDKKKYGILLGGFGTLGTEAAVYYFCKNIALIEKHVGKHCFSLIVRARIHSGAQSVKMIKEYPLKIYDGTDRICPNCGNRLRKEQKIYSKGLRRNDPIVESDISSKSIKDIYSRPVSASGYGFATKSTNIKQHLSKVPEVALINIKFICDDCGYIDER